MSASLRKRSRPAWFDICAVSLTSWTREVASQLRTATGTVKTAAFLVLACALAFGTLLAVLLGAGAGPVAALDAKTLAYLLGSIFITAVFLTSLFCMLTPPRHALATVLDTLPVQRTAAFIGLQLPAALLTLILTVSFSLATLTSIWRAQETAAIAAAAVAATLVYVLVSQTVCVAVFNLLRFVFRSAIRFPRYYASSFAGVLCMGLATAVVWTDMIPSRDGISDGGLREFTLHRSWARFIASLGAGTGTAWLDFGILLLWLAAAAALIRLVSGADKDNKEDGAMRLLSKVSLPRRRVSAMAVVDIRQLLRTPQFLVLLLLLLSALAGCLALTLIPDADFMARFIAPSLLAAPFFIGMQAYGIIKPSHWLLRHLTGRSWFWSVPILLASLSLSLLLCVPFAVALTLSGLLSMTQLPEAVFPCLIAWLSAMIGGIVVPFSREQPLASSATGFTVLMLYLASSSSAQWLASTVGGWLGDAGALAAPLVNTLITVVMAGLLVLAINRASTHAVA